MQSVELNRQLQRIDDLITATRDLTEGNIELQGHWGKYLCVLAAGFFENAIGEIYIDFIQRASSPPIASFTGKTLRRIQNPKTSRFREVAFSFKEEWGKEIDDYIVDHPEVRDGIDSIMANRHLIVHGKISGISVIRVQNYLEEGTKLLTLLEKQCS